MDVYFRAPLIQLSIERRSIEGPFFVAWSVFPVLDADQRLTENVETSG